MNLPSARVCRWTQRCLGFLCAAVLCGTVVFAQSVPSRFELGHRLRRLERVLESRNQIEDRARVLPHMEAAVQAFFSMNPVAVAQRLDRAYVGLLALEVRGAGSSLDWTTEFANRVRLVVRGDRFLQGSRPASLQFELSELYVPTGEAQEKTERKGRAWLQAADDSVVTSKDISLEPGEFYLDLPEDWAAEDYELRVSTRVGEIEVDVARMQISWIPDFEARLAKIDAQLKQNEDWDPNLRASVEFDADMLRRAYARQTSEMDLPALRVLKQAESMVSMAAQGDWLADQGEEFWLSLRGQSEKGPKGRGYFRVFRPAGESAGPRACVIALHGAGGSENMFFDGYGDGLIRRLCSERGWVLVAPRCSFAGVGLPMRQVLDALQGPLGIDPTRVFLVGHSMGVGAEASILRATKSDTDSAFRGVAAIGGGWGGLRGETLQETPFLVVTGSNDFAQGVSRLAHESLVEQAVSSRLLELPQVEHMGVVQFSLPQVFEFFDACLKPKDE